jgi:putative glutathione S-transferase
MNLRHVQFPECTLDTVFGEQRYVKTIYELAGVPDQRSVPILLDKETKTIVNNESAEIVRMLGTDMKEFGNGLVVPDLYPVDLREKIDKLNDWIYTTIANGSYKAGFSSNQDVYEAAYSSYFEALDQLDDMLKDSMFLTGSTVTEADVRLFPPLFRHDPVYYNRFKLNKKYLWEYPNIWRWMSDMVALPGMEPVSNAGYLAHCTQGYFGRTGNGTLPVGPDDYPDCYRDPNWIPNSVARLLRLRSNWGNQ